MIIPNIFPLPIHLVDGGRWDQPIATDIAQGPPRYAQIACNHGWDVSGKLVIQAPFVPHDQGWLDMVEAMGLYTNTTEVWRSLCQRLIFLFDTTLPVFDQHDVVTAWITRDAVGWTTGVRHNVERIPGPDGTPIWPWLWSRPRTSAHQHAQRVQRFQDDVQWMGNTIMEHKTP